MKRKQLSLLFVAIFVISVFGQATTQSVADATYKIDLWYTPSHYGSDENLVADLIAEQLRATNYFDVNIKSAEWSTYLDQRQTMGFYLLGWWFDYPDPSNYVDPFVGSGAESFGTFYSSAAMNASINTMLTDPSQTARDTASKAAQNLMAEDVPVIPLFSMLKQFSAMDKGITGYNLEPSENVHYNSIADGGDNNIILGTTDSITSLDPADVYDYFSSNTLVQLTHGLMEMPTTSTTAVKGPFVDSFKVSADAMNFTFVLKDNYVFSNGNPVDAAAIKYNLNRSRNLEVDGVEGDPAFLLDGIESIVVNDPLNVTINLSSPDATFLQKLTYTNAWIFDPSTLPSNDFTGLEKATVPSGLGPYVVDSWTPNTELILKPNANYNGTIPTNQITVTFFTDASALLTALETGSIELAQKQFGPDEITSIKDNADLKFVEKETAGTRYLLINVEQHTNKMVRQAMSYAVDRAEITARVFGDLNEPLYSMVPKIFDSSIAAFPQTNVTMAQELMKDAGFTGRVDEGGAGFLDFGVVSIIAALSMTSVVILRKRRV